MAIPGLSIPMGAPPAAMPSINQGSAAAAMGKVREAIKLLEMALPELPTGSQVHKVVAGTISSLAKHVPSSEGTQAIQMSTLRDLQQNAQQAAPLQALMRAMQAGGQQGQPPQMGQQGQSSGA